MGDGLPGKGITWERVIRCPKGGYGYDPTSVPNKSVE